MQWLMERRLTLTLAVGFLLAVSASAQQPSTPVAWWTFDEEAENTALDVVTGTQDLVLGSYGTAPGVSGRALKLDGYTTRVVRRSTAAPRITDGLTVEAWVALAAYPWNRSAIVANALEPYAGYYVGIGPRGELTLRLMVDGRWRTLESRDYAVPLRRWTHVAATYDRHGLALYVDGEEVGRHQIQTEGHRGSGRRSRGLTGQIESAGTGDLLIGMNPQPLRPFDWHRLEGTRPAWYSLDGLLDEVRVFDVALTPAQVARAHAEYPTPGEPELAPRVMPAGPPGPGRFGAYYTRLEYYPEWDALWQVGSHPDVVVRFDRSPARLVFWRGTQYGPAWVTENNLWMADQSVEGYDRDFTWEHMNDKQNRYSHVRVMEETDARVVVHWRYAPVNVLNELWNVDEKTGNGAWIDEYYYVYPDAVAVRKVTWQADRLGRPVQFQESLPFTHAGQLQGDVIHIDYVTVGNLRGESRVFSYVADPKDTPDGVIPADLTIQMHNLKAPQKPFIVFEPGNRMGYLRDLDIRSLSVGAHHSHWPVAQIPSDGRTNQAPDGPGHLVGFPISRPLVHRAGGREWWNGLYGMTEEGFAGLVPLARSWSVPPQLRLQDTVFAARGFDRSERAYKLAREVGESGSPAALSLELLASSEAPLRNVALEIENWGEDDAALLIDGQQVPRGPRFRYGHRHTLTGTDLLVWIELALERPVALTLTPTR
jgi:hypothetical protein